MSKRGGSLFDRYRAHHELDRPLLQWIGVVGVVAFPILYLLRRAAADSGYELPVSVEIRLDAPDGKLFAMASGAGSAPARSSTARSVADWPVKLPEI